MKWMRSPVLTLLVLAATAAGVQAQEMTLSVAVSLKEAIEDLGRTFTAG